MRDNLFCAPLGGEYLVVRTALAATTGGRPSRNDFTRRAVRRAFVVSFSGRATPRIVGRGRFLQLSARCGRSSAARLIRSRRRRSVGGGERVSGLVSAGPSIAPCVQYVLRGMEFYSSTARAVNRSMYSTTHEKRGTRCRLSSVRSSIAASSPE